MQMQVGNPSVHLPASLPHVGTTPRPKARHLLALCLSSPSALTPEEIALSITELREAKPFAVVNSEPLGADSRNVCPALC